MSVKIHIPLSTLEKHNHIIGDIERGVKLYERGGVEFADDPSLGYIADIPERDGQRVKLTFTEDGRNIESFYCAKCSMRSGRAICRHVVAGILAIQGGFPEEETLETERLVLRPFSIYDFDAVHSWAGNPENVRYMAWGPNDEAQTRSFLSAAKPGYDFAVVIKDTMAVIGSCGIYPDNQNDTGTVGWILHKDHWKHGYGTELAGELIRYGFEDLKLRRITAPCAAVNYGSYRVMERNDMRREALHRKAFWARVDREWIDEAVYAILAEDYFAGEGNSKTVKRLECFGDVSDRQHDLSEALRAINSTISKCEKAQLKLAEGTSQHTLTKRRLEAFYIATALIEKEMLLNENGEGNDDS